MHVLIVDDELLARNRIRVLLSECEDPVRPFSVEEASTVAQAQEILSRTELPFDLVLLDIQMPGADGTHLARIIHKMQTPPAVVFVTAHAAYASHAFDLNATDYLTKPVRLERLQQAIAKVRRARALTGSTSDTAPALIIRDRGRAERVPLPLIIYLKAEQKYVTVRTAVRTYIMDSSLNELEHRFPNYFLRIHRNALVNPSQIRHLEKQFVDEEGECWALRLHSIPDILQVSRRQLSTVRATLQSLIRRTEDKSALQF